MDEPARILSNLDGKIARIARRVARLPDDIDDVEQAARIAVWEAAAEHGDSVGEGYFVQAAKWAAQQEAARLARQRRDAYPIEGLEYVLAEPPHQPPRVDAGDVRAAVGRLPLRHRSVIQVRYFGPAALHHRSAGFQTNTQGLSRRNTAKELRLSESQVRVAERQALVMLHDDLAA